jgi:polyferredoxin
MFKYSASLDEAGPARGAAARIRKALVRKLTPDRSQQTRRAVQFAFFALNVCIGALFLRWVHSFEVPGQSIYVERPAGVDGWLPIAGLMNLRYFLGTGDIPAVHPSAMVLFCAFLLCSVLVKKAFCSWLCPVGTVSEYLWKLGRRLFRRSLILPKWLDLPLRSLKYLLLAFFIFIVFTMSVGEVADFQASPFAIIADVKMLNFFRYMGIVGIAIMATLVVLSILIQNFWCRFLCPYGALMGIVSTISPVKIRRDAQACIDCGKCNKACPSQLLVDNLVQIRSAECTGCMECVAVCPAENALQFALPPRRGLNIENPSPAEIAARWYRRVPQPWLVAAILAVVFFGLIGAARATGHWQTKISRDTYMQLVPDSQNVQH